MVCLASSTDLQKTIHIQLRELLLIVELLLEYLQLKFKPKLNSKFMLKGSKTIKITKGSKNRGG